MNLRFILSDNIINVFAELKEKIFHLSDTNYQLGLNHLNNGHIWEALSRFKIITFFWPHHYEARYQYAYCLLLSNRIDNSRKVLTEILAEHPNHTKAKDLLISINNQDIEKIKEEYKTRLQAFNTD